MALWDKRTHPNLHCICMRYTGVTEAADQRLSFALHADSSFYSYSLIIVQRSLRRAIEVPHWVAPVDCSQSHLQLMLIAVQIPQEFTTDVQLTEGVARCYI